MWGQVTIGGIAFRETVAVAQADDGGLRISGQESYPPSTKASVRAAHQNVVAMRDQLVPVTFTDKSSLTGFFRVRDASSTLTDRQNGAVVTADWSMTLERLGTGRDVEFETRLPMVPRTDELTGAQSPSYWHAPPAGFGDYYTGTQVPASTIQRQSADGMVTVHLGLPTTVPPRWTCPAESYLNGAARILLDGIRRAGTVTPPHTSWEISNGLVRLTGSGNAVALSVWRGAPGWSTPKDFRPLVSGAMVAATPEFTILRNDPEEVVARLTYPTSPGRITLDLSLRRGSRFVAGVLKRHSAAALGLRPAVAETTGTAQTGGVLHAATGEAIRTLIGTSRATTLDGATGGISKASITVFDFFLGAEVGTPQNGDAFADLLLQYLGTSGDRTRGMRR